MHLRHPPAPNDRTQEFSTMTPNNDLLRLPGSFDASPGMPKLGHIPVDGEWPHQLLLWVAPQ